MRQKDIDVQERNARAIQRTEEQEREQAQQIEDVQWQMASAVGRRIMWRLLGDCGVFQSSFTGNSETFFREGKREVGLRRMSEIMEHCPQQFTTMMQENGAK